LTDRHFGDLELCLINILGRGDISTFRYWEILLSDICRNFVMSNVVPPG